jgi:hypothetical protein
VNAGLPGARLALWQKQSVCRVDLVKRHPVGDVPGHSLTHSLLVELVSSPLNSGEVDYIITVDMTAWVCVGECGSPRGSTRALTETICLLNWLSQKTPSRRHPGPSLTHSRLPGAWLMLWQKQSVCRIDLVKRHPVGDVPGHHSLTHNVHFSACWISPIANSRACRAHIVKWQKHQFYF